MAHPVSHQAQSSSSRASSASSAPQTDPGLASVTNRVNQAAQERLPLIVACYINKGGVGKTTASLNIGWVLSQDLGLRVLLVDADFQTSLTALIEGANFTSRINEFYEEHQKKYTENRIRTNIAQVFREPLSQRQISENGREADEVVITPIRNPAKEKEERPYYDHFYYIPGHPTINDMDHEIELGFGRIGLYRDLPGSVTNLLRKIGKKNNIDMVLIDLSPGGSGFNKAVLWGSDYFYAPYFLEPLAINALQTLSSSLERGTRLYQNNPGHDFSDVADKEMAAMGCEPKFLGAFPQNVPLKAPPGTQNKLSRKRLAPSVIRSYRVPNITQMDQREKADQLLTTLEKTLRKHHLLSDHFKPLSDCIVSRMASAYIRAQDQGCIVIDPRVTIRRPTKAGEEHKGGREDQKTKNQRATYLQEFRLITGCLLLNMKPEDLAVFQQRDPTIEKTLRTFASIFTIRDWKPRATVSPSHPRPRRGHDYADEEIRVLAQYYVSQGPNSDKSKVWAHLHLGRQRGHSVGGETTIEGIVERLEADKEAFLNQDYTYFYLPIGLGSVAYADASGGGHWTLLYGIKNVAGLIQLYYFDPLGQELPRLLKSACEQLFPEIIGNEIRSPRIQGEDNNCGPWVIEAIRRLVHNERVPNEEEAIEIDINEIRKAQQELIQKIREDEERREAASSQSSKKKPRRS